MEPKLDIWKLGTQFQPTFTFCIRFVRLPTTFYTTHRPYPSGCVHVRSLGVIRYFPGSWAGHFMALTLLLHRLRHKTAPSSSDLTLFAIITTISALLPMQTQSSVRGTRLRSWDSRRIGGGGGCSVVGAVRLPPVPFDC